MEEFFRLTMLGIRVQIEEVDRDYVCDFNSDELFKIC